MHLYLIPNKYIQSLNLLNLGENQQPFFNLLTGDDLLNGEYDLSKQILFSKIDDDFKSI